MAALAETDPPGLTTRPAGPRTPGVLLREFLADSDSPCPMCGYNLRGLLTAACPECGVALRLQVGMREARMGMFLAAVVGLATGGGSAGLLLATLVGGSLYFGGWPPGELFVVPVFAAAMEGGGLVLLVRRRGRVWFRERPGSIRWMAIIVTWAATLAWPVALVWVIAMW